MATRPRRTRSRASALPFLPLLLSPLAAVVLLLAGAGLEPAAAFSLEGFQLLGDAERTASGSVRLTHDDLGAPAAGGMFARSGVGRRWEFQVLLNAHGRRNRGGAGFAFWYVAEPPPSIRAPGPLFGGSDSFYGFALFLSSSSSSSLSSSPSSSSPSSSAAASLSAAGSDAGGEPGGGGWAGGFFNDGGPFDRQELVHGHSRGRNSCRLDFRNHVVNDRGPTLLRIAYDGTDLSVRVSEPQETAFRECFTLQDVELPEGYYYGVTAATTADLADLHDVYALEALALPPDASTDGPIAPPLENSGGDSDSGDSGSGNSSSDHGDDGAPSDADGGAGGAGGGREPAASAGAQAPPKTHHDASLDFLVSQSDVVVALAAQHQDFARRLREAEAGCDAELGALRAHVDILIAKLSLAEEDARRTMQQLEQLVHQQMDAFEADHRSYRGAWVAPLLGIAAALAGLALVGVNRYRFLVKRHIL